MARLTPTQKHRLLECILRQRRVQRRARHDKGHSYSNGSGLFLSHSRAECRCCGSRVVLLLNPVGWTLLHCVQQFFLSSLLRRHSALATSTPCFCGLLGETLDCCSMLLDCRGADVLCQVAACVESTNWQRPGASVHCVL
jgi:hypothetical protein